mmetsp:Transcript_40469/g.61728  ORF Transcript_40469/g.61728 Transcript_40469/m.61728 type:complete len:82 (-) Transcript_40469:357-602(-)
MIKAQTLAILVTISVAILSFVNEYYWRMQTVKEILISSRMNSLLSTGIAKGSIIQSQLQMHVNELEIQSHFLQLLSRRQIS